MKYAQCRFVHAITAALTAFRIVSREVFTVQQCVVGLCILFRPSAEHAGREQDEKSDMPLSQLESCMLVSDPAVLEPRWTVISPYLRRRVVCFQPIFVLLYRDFHMSARRPGG